MVSAIDEGDEEEQRLAHGRFITESDMYSKAPSAPTQPSSAHHS